MMDPMVHFQWPLRGREASCGDCASFCVLDRKVSKSLGHCAHHNATVSNYQLCDYHTYSKRKPKNAG